MSLSRTLTRFVFLAAIGHQVTYTLVEGSIFEEAREQVGTVHPKLRQFVHCHLCVGTWVGVTLAAAYRPGLLADVDIKHPSLARRTLDVAGDGLLLGLGIRVWNEGLGWLRRQVQVKDKEVQVKEAEVRLAPARRAVSLEAGHD